MRLLEKPNQARNVPQRKSIEAVVELKRRNSQFACPRIVQQINQAFGISIEKDVVRRLLAAHYLADPSVGGPSWLTFLGHTTDSIWSVDLFRCESILLKRHWVLVVMDQFTRGIVGFGVQPGEVDGVSLCCLFNNRKLESFRQYYNQHQVHQALNGQSPAFVGGDVEHQCAQLSQHSWQSHCKGLFQTPMAACF